MQITTLGIDVAKQSFQLHGSGKHGTVVLTKHLSRAKVLPFMAQFPPCLIGLEVSDAFVGSDEDPDSVAIGSGACWRRLGLSFSKGSPRSGRPSPLLEEAENGLTWEARARLQTLAAKLRVLDQRLEQPEHQIGQAFEHSDLCQRLAQMEGIAPLMATAFVAAVGDAATFTNGRQLATWLGLMPRQHPSGGKSTLLGISRGGQTYLRKLRIHGARAVIRTVERQADMRSRRLHGVRARRGTNRACVARGQDGPDRLGPAGEGRAAPPGHLHVGNETTTAAY
jgi:transposase